MICSWERVSPSLSNEDFCAQIFRNLRKEWLECSLFSFNSIYGISLSIFLSDDYLEKVTKAYEIINTSLARHRPTVKVDVVDVVLIVCVDGQGASRGPEHT